MTLVHRVLSSAPIASLDEYLAQGGGAGIETARTMGPDELIREVESSGLRGRGGAGFPTGVKWRTVRDYHASGVASTVVVNGAEGEPGTFKDRAILRANPYGVIEGALIGARAVGADEIVFGLKKSFAREVSRLSAAIAEVKAAGWAEGVRLAVFEGPDEYLYGEETALLESIDGRYPFPRIAPPYRRGDREVVTGPADVDTGSGLSAHVEMAGPQGEPDVPPTLVDNVETMANIPRIIGRGGTWFRTEGTGQSPGTIVCTVTGDVQREGVGEVVMGTPLRDVIIDISGGPRPGRRIKAVLPGVANGFIGEDQLDTPVSYEDLAAIGSGLGAGGFLVFDDRADLVSVAAGVSRFLAVESCGQCTPCKRDGLALSRLLAGLSRSEASRADLEEIRSLTATVADRARCFLATQHQVVVQSILDRFESEVTGHLTGRAAPAEPRLIAEVTDIEDDIATVEERHAGKQPDWTYSEEWSGKAPADLYADHRHPLALEE